MDPRTLIKTASDLRKIWHNCRSAGLQHRWECIAHCLRNPEAPSILRVPLLPGGGMLIDLREVVSQDIFMFRVFEPELTDFFLTYIKPGDIFFDVGAHFGYFSIIANIALRGNGRIVAFEPTVHTFQHRLVLNCEGLKEVTTENLAAWNETTEIEFHEYGLGQSAFNSFTQPRLLPSQQSSSNKTVIVRAVSLDDYCKKDSIVPSFVKIDVESAESKVLEGMSNLLATARPVVTIEVGDINPELKSVVKSSAETLRLVLHYEYELFEYKENKLVRHDLLSGPYGYDNIIALPKKGELRDRFDTSAV